MFFCVYERLTCMYVHTTICVSGVCRGQKRVLGLLKLEVWMFVIYHVGARNQTHVFWKSTKCFLLLSYLTSPRNPILSLTSAPLSQNLHSTDGLRETEVWKLFTDSRLYHPILTHLPALISDLVQARQCVRRLSKRRLGFSYIKLLNEWDSMIWSSKNTSGKFIFCYENEKLNLYFSMDKRYLFSTGIP